VSEDVICRLITVSIFPCVPTDASPSASGRLATLYVGQDILTFHFVLTSPPFVSDLRRIQYTSYHYISLKIHSNIILPFKLSKYLASVQFSYRNIPFPLHRSQPPGPPEPPNNIWCSRRKKPTATLCRAEVQVTLTTALRNFNLSNP
jgi:hypothetical protein